MKQISFSRHAVRLASAAALVGAVFTTIAVNVNRATAADDVPLDQLAQRVGEIRDSEGVQMAELAPPNSLSMSDPANPLVAVHKSAPSTLSRSYLEAYHISKLLPSKLGSVVVQIYAYRFAANDQSEAAAKEFVNTALTDAKTGAARVVPHGISMPSQDDSFTFTGSEGTSINWHVAVRGRTLILVMVEGGALPSTQTVFQDVLKTIPER